MSEHVLEILDGDRAGEVISLSRDRVTFGRRPNNDVTLKDEKASGQHAELVREGGQWVLRDLESTNGTFLDGRKVKEVGLSPGDVFQVGLTKVCFRRAGDASPAVAVAAGGDEFALHRVDQAQLQRVRKKGGTLGLLVALLVAAGAGAWVWLTFGGGDGGPRRAPRTVDAVPGNLLAAEVAGAESGAGWDLGAAGGTFTVSGPAHGGHSALVAVRGDGPAFALARLAEPQRVLAEESLRVLGYLRTEASGAAALRLRFSSSREGDTHTLTVGTAAQGVDEWTAVDAAFAVPPGMDRVQIEVLALLPGADATVAVDDLALVKGGEARATNLSARNGVRLVGSGSALALALGEDLLLQGLRPLPAPGSPLAAAEAPGLAVLSDAGIGVDAELTDESFTLALRGGTGLALEFAGADGLTLRPAAGAAFTAAGEDLDQEVAEVVLGAGTGRLALGFGGPMRVRGLRSVRGWRLAVPAASTLTIRVGFEPERRAARDRVRDARAAVAARRFGDALGVLGEVVEQYAYDDAALAEAQQVRAEVLQGLNARLDQVERDLETARFFQARSGLVRVRADLDAVIAAYGEANIARRELLERVRTESAAMLAELDAQAIGEKADGLRRLAEAFDSTGNAALAKLIQDYLAQHGGK